MVRHGWVPLIQDLDRARGGRDARVQGMSRTGPTDPGSGHGSWIRTGQGGGGADKCAGLGGC